MKHIPLTLDEHRKVGSTLAMIQNELTGERWLSFKKTSPLKPRLRRAIKDIGRLRMKLSEVLYAQHPEITNHLIYYGDTPQREDHSIQSLEEYLKRDVYKIINGRKVGAAVTDVYLRCDRSLFSLNIWIGDHPDEVSEPSLKKNPDLAGRSLDR